MSLEKPSVCLQINVAPSDLRYLKHTVPHQMRVFADQVSEIQFTLDTRPQRNSKYRAEGFERNLSTLREELNEFCLRYAHANVREIDFSEPMVREISNALGIPAGIPINALNGSPFYGYVFGIYEAKSDFVIHLDADMLFGGGSTTWVSEAVAALRSNERILVVNPLPGPPTRNGEIAQKYVERVAAPYPAFTFDQISSRVIFAERKRLLFDYTLPILPAKGAQRLMAMVNNMPPVDAFELCLTAMLTQHNLLRLDMLGENGGLWSLHPPYRSERFYERLPAIIAEIEAGDIPEKQRGDYDLNDSMIDWSDARRARAFNRVRRYVGYAANGIFRRSIRQ